MLRGLLKTGLLLAPPAALAALGWRYADLMRATALDVRAREPPAYDLEVLVLSGDSITLGPTPETRNGDWAVDGVWGIEHAGGYAQAGAISRRGERDVVRGYTPLLGNLTAGDRVRLDNFAFAGDPLTAFGRPFEAVSFPAPLGDLPAWLVPAPGSTWAVFVHGRDSNPREALRILPAVAGAGLPLLAIAYRNDAGAPRSPDGRYGFGATEWEDLEAALSYGISRGAKDFVLIGYSMGGAIALSFLLRSRLAGRVRGVILDAPVLDLAALADFWAKRQGLAAPLSAWGRQACRLRLGLDWRGLDYLARADRLSAPVLLFHGAADPIVPVATSDRLAALRPDLVEYVRNSSATHMRCWNLDPDGYAARVRGFLRRVSAGEYAEAEVEGA